MFEKYRLNKKTFFILLASFFIAFFSFIGYLYYQRVGAFGCFDDCINFYAGYFMLSGKTLYSQIFFNHQMIAAYISYLIQFLFSPSTAYQLVLYHRVFIFAVSVVMGALIIYRFRVAGFLFVLFYELTKYYLFGYRFLGEAIVVYLLVYLFGLFWDRLSKKEISTAEYFLSAIFAWFVIFTREPYVPVALVLFAVILWDKNIGKIKYLPLALFLGLSALTLFTVPLDEYFFNVFTVNAKTIGAIEVYENRLFGTGLFKIFFYPVYILFYGKWNDFRIILVGLNIIFLSQIVVSLFLYRNFRKILFALFVLGLSNIRYVMPGTIFYEAFHLTVWYGLFMIFSSLLYQDIKARKIKYVLSISFFAVFFYIFFSPTSFIYDKINKDFEFTSNYGHDFVYGQVIKALADPSDTLFLDGWDELIYYHAGIASSYKYSAYTSVMPRFEKYTQARHQMFVDSPPDFYYGNCPEGKSPVLPGELQNDYRQLYFDGKPACLYIKKSKLTKIDEAKFEKVRQFGFYLK